MSRESQKKLEESPWLKTLCDECYDKKLKDNDKLNVIV